MKIITPKDAFGLALIALRPQENKDLIDKLSDAAKPIGIALVDPSTINDFELQQTVKLFQEWAAHGKSKKRRT